MDGTRLHDLCEENGTTLWGLIKDYNLPQSTVYALANGQNDIDKAGISLFFRIADALGMTADELRDALENDDAQ